MCDTVLIADSSAGAAGVELSVSLGADSVCDELLVSAGGVDSDDEDSEELLEAGVSDAGAADSVEGLASVVEVASDSVAAADSFEVEAAASSAVPEVAPA